MHIVMTTTTFRITGPMCGGSPSQNGQIVKGINIFVGLSQFLNRWWSNRSHKTPQRLYDFTLLNQINALLLIHAPCPLQLRSPGSSETVSQKRNIKPFKTWILIQTWNRGMHFTKYTGYNPVMMACWDHKSSGISCHYEQFKCKYDHIVKPI